VFDAWGAPLVVVSSLVASLVAFLLSRHALRPKVRLLLANRPLLRAIDAAIGSQSCQVAILLRLNALVPFNFQSYFFGATDIGLVPYTIGTLFGIMPFTTMYVYLGTVGRTIVIEERFGASNIALLLFSLVATAGLIYFVGQKTKQKLHEMSATGG
jgi:uncharacterized membrane protein YdjX (TVP38/TMEM64 family)